MTVGPLMASAEPSPSLLDLPPHVASTPVRALNVSCQTQLAKHLNVEKDTLENGKATDWRGLGECCDFDSLELDNFKRNASPTSHILREWSRTPEATIGRLVEFLKEMGRWDIIEDELICQRVEHDVNSYWEAVERKKRLEEAEDDDATVVSYPASGALVKGDEGGHLEYFDAFVCYTHADFEWVHTMMLEMEQKSGLKLCIIGRDLLPGTCKYSAIATLIKERCRKMVIIISQDYNKSDECDFQTHFAHALAPGSRSKRLIPVVIKKNITVPDVLRPITLLDYTKDDLIEWFWGKLEASIKDAKTIFPKSDFSSVVEEGDLKIHELTMEELSLPPQPETLPWTQVPEVPLPCTAEPIEGESPILSLTISDGPEPEPENRRPGGLIGRLKVYLKKK